MLPRLSYEIGTRADTDCRVSFKSRKAYKGVVDSFIQWCRQTREDFGLGPAIEAELGTRKGTLELTHSYRQWREMAKEDPAMARRMGFKDNPKRKDEESLSLKMATVPEWMPGTSMRRGSHA